MGYIFIKVYHRIRKKKTKQQKHGLPYQIIEYANRMSDKKASTVFEFSFKKTSFFSSPILKILPPPPQKKRKICIFKQNYKQLNEFNRYLFHRNNNINNSTTWHKIYIDYLRKTLNTFIWVKNIHKCLNSTKAYEKTNVISKQ